MALLNRFRGAVGAAVEAYLHADTPDGDAAGPEYDGWNTVEARRFRYALGWSLYQNTAFRDVHRWAAELRRAFGLYLHVRNVYCPVDRLVEFHASHVYGGNWDDEAGDGKEVPSAAPIVGRSVTPALRRVIARLWRDSLWALNAEAWVRRGAINGDAPVKVVPDLRRGKVVFEVQHPRHFSHVTFDSVGHVKEYVIEKRMRDPRQGAPRPGEAVRYVTYEERCERDGDLVVFSTFLVDGGRATPWNWSDDPDAPAEWAVPYGFTPIVWTKHIDLGLDFGAAEFHTSRPKIVECDDQASKLNDQIRKVVEPKWFFAGVKAPARDDAGRSRLDIGANGRARDHDDPEPSRREEGAVYAADAAAKAQALVADLQIADALANIASLIEEVERGFPELRFDRLRAGGDVSGESLRVARQPTETKINRRRRRYDTDLVRLHQMGAAIGGYLFRELRDARFEDFAAFDLDSFAAGALDHMIGPRAVFGEDPFELAAIRRANYEAIEVAVRAGIPRRKALMEAGYTDEQVDEMESQAEAEAKVSAERMAASRKAMGFDGPADNEDAIPPEEEEEGDA